MSERRLTSAHLKVFRGESGIVGNLIHDLDLERAEKGKLRGQVKRLHKILKAIKTKTIDCLNKGGPYTHVLLDVNDLAQAALEAVPGINEEAE
ncbi:hypothetical protein LCGC14_0338430 [marine sediment metagenome]|uniref:Uncharacterized protein n=1 Tax=marine sediment metagenome TaxID=412755 RepID=A0A0F9TK18_9ZZZZ